MRSFIRRHRQEILARWRTAARKLPGARDLSPVVLVDHVPELLDQVAEIADEIASEGDVDPLTMARRHALDRLAEGFEITTVVAELSLLRGCIFAVQEHEQLAIAEMRALDLAIDRAIAVSVQRYTEVHERTMAGIDRISTAVVEAEGLDEVLRRFLAVFQETTPAVDTAAILLRDGDALRMRAAVGLEGEVERGATFAIGEGFAGTIAQTRRELQLRSAYTDPVVLSEVIRAKKVRALYGVPLINEDRLIGVAHMGSIRASSFSAEDRQLFSSMASRATLGIVHHQLRQELADSAGARGRALAKLESLLAASPIGIAFVDRELRYLRINEALAALNGRTAAEHIGKHVEEVVPEFATILVPLLQGVLSTGQPMLNYELTAQIQGEQHWLLANFFPVRTASDVTGVGCIVLDVTEAKRAQQRLESILEHAPAAIWLKEPDGKIVLANHRLAAALGHALDNVTGHRSDELLPSEIANLHQEHDQLVLREMRSIQVEESVPSPDGDRTFLSIKFPIPGAPPLVGGIATEITDRKRMEQELRASVRTREELLAVVSHDLRNPLGTIELSASMLGQVCNEPRARRHLEMISRSCQRMEHLIDDLLDIANIRAGRLSLEIKREPIDSLVHEAVDLQRPFADEKRIALALDANTGLDVDCDRDRVLQVFGNLIGNALKFCRTGDTITVTCTRDGNCVRCSVADTGPGITPEVVKRLFDPYWSAPEHQSGGSGLGLYIARGIIEGHRGRLWVESTPGAGATFYFTLPIAA